MAGKKIVIIGGGLSGLAYAHYLKHFAKHLNKLGALSSIKIFEKSSKVGGQLESIRGEDGIVHEMGPKYLKTVGLKAKNTIVLLETLKLHKEIIKAEDTTKNPASIRYIYKDGQFDKQPTSLKLFGKIPFTNKYVAVAAYKEAKKHSIDLDSVPFRDPTVYDFIEYRFGKEVAENLADPIIRHLTCVDAKSLSTKATFPELLFGEQRAGSIIKSMLDRKTSYTVSDEFLKEECIESELVKFMNVNRVSSYTLFHGLQRITDKLCSSLLESADESTEINIHTQTSVEAIDYDSDKRKFKVSLKTIDGDIVDLDADIVVGATNSSDIANLLADPILADNRLANLPRLFNSIKHVPVVNCSVKYTMSKEQVPERVNSFILQTHSSSNSKLLSVTMDSSMFPTPEQEVGKKTIKLSTSLGGSWFKEAFGINNIQQITQSQVENIVCKELRSLIGFKNDPNRILTSHFTYPSPEPGHLNTIEELEKTLNAANLPLKMIGKSVNGINTHEIIYGARKSAWELMKSL